MAILPSPEREGQKEANDADHEPDLAPESEKSSFRTLAKRLLGVSREELRERERQWKADRGVRRH